MTGALQGVAEAPAVADPLPEVGAEGVAFALAVAAPEKEGAAEAVAPHRSEGLSDAEAQTVALREPTSLPDAHALTEPLFDAAGDALCEGEAVKDREELKILFAELSEESRGLGDIFGVGSKWERRRA